MVRAGWRSAAVGAAAAVMATALAEGASQPAPRWDVSGRWDGYNGAEYLIVRQHRDGTADLTVHHTCAPGHVERGRGRVRGTRLEGRVEPRLPPPATCVRYAIIDVRVAADGRRLQGTYRSDRGGGDLLYYGRQQARSLVRFRPALVRRGADLQVLLRPSFPLPGSASVRLCARGACATRTGRHGPTFPRRRGCHEYRATVSFAGARGTARRRVCT